MNFAPSVLTGTGASFHRESAAALPGTSTDESGFVLTDSHIGNLSDRVEQPEHPMTLLRRAYQI